MKKILLAAAILALLPSGLAEAQSTAAQTISGYLSTSCGSAPSPCFIQYGSTLPFSGTITAPLGNQAPSASVSTTGAVGSALAPSIIALSTTASSVLSSGTNYVSRIVCNDDAAIIEYFGPSGVTSAGVSGVKVIPGQCWDFSHNTAAIYGVAASGTPNARVVQY